LQESNFEQIEEDRRLFFVAITRAKENLFLSYPA
jgi:superfamily I DNA/RNA helicase